LGEAPAIDPARTTIGVPGVGGDGGNTNLKGNKGADGAAQEVQTFGAPQ
jgi:hypothetical protein